MKSDFFDDVSNFLNRLKSESVKLKGNDPFERLMQGLSNGSVDFRWGFGGRFKTHIEPLKKPNLMWLRYAISAPFIYAMILPILFLDISVSLYQAICFRLWHLPQVLRSKHVVIDRHRLEYLNWFQKFNCIYCGYANGVMSYARTIAGKTESYWCPVKHETDVPVPHKFYIEFAEYDDPEDWNERHTSGVDGWGNGSSSWGR